MLSTTELLVEHIISGILSLIWILALVFCVTGLDLRVFPIVKDYWVLFALVITAIAYPMGIFVDTIADKLLNAKNDKIRKKNNLGDDFSLMMLIHKMKDDNIRGYFTYNRFKTRVARSSMLNFTMMAISIFLFLIIRGKGVGIENPLNLGITVLVLFSILSLTAYYLWREIAITTYKRGSSLWQELKH